MSGDQSEPADDVSKEPSEEVDERQLELARAEGDAYHRSLEYMANEVAHTGGTKQLGDYIVGFAQEEAEGMYALTEEGEFEWREPESENCHIEISVSDAADKRFVPYLDVRATLVDKEGTETGPFEVPFLWHPGLYHYGRNVEVPGDGAYTLRVAIDPPTFMRHDEKNGDRYGERVEVEFEGVDIETGQS
jgi:hypothetical protein